MPTVTPTSPRAPTCFYSQAAVGEMGLSTVRQAVERELTFSKGLQGILIVGEFRSVKSHLKIARADTVEEARLCFRMGRPRTARPSMHRSEGLLCLFQCDLRTEPCAAQRLLHIRPRCTSEVVLLLHAFLFPQPFRRDLGSTLQPVASFHLRLTTWIGVAHYPQVCSGDMGHQPFPPLPPPPPGPPPSGPTLSVLLSRAARAQAIGNGP